MIWLPTARLQKNLTSANPLKPTVRYRPIADVQSLTETARMDTLEDLRLDREHVAHLLYECRDGRHPATLDNEADLQRELKELDTKIAMLSDEV